MKKLLTLLAVAFCLNGMGQIITTVAGGGNCGSFYCGDGGQATNARLYEPSAIVFDAVGNLFIADASNNLIRKVNTSGIITTIAGIDTAAAGYSGDGGQATNAKLNYPESICIDGVGNIYIADAENMRIRKINTLGIINTFAGNGVQGFIGDGGQATAAELYAPSGMVFDALGNLYIADEGNDVIRKINTLGIITTVAGNGYGGGVGDGGQATAAELHYPAGVAFDAAGNLYIADSDNMRVRKVNTLGIITTIAGNGTVGYSGDGGQATAAELYFPQGVTFDAAGNLYIPDSYNMCIRKVNTLGVINTIAGNGTVGYSGDGGLATAAELNYPFNVAFDTHGNIYIADFYNLRIRKITPPLVMSVNSTTICAGTTTTLTASGATSYTWSPTTGLSSTTGSMVVANPTVTTTYTVIGATGDSMSLATSIVTVMQTPTITVTPPNPFVCNGGTTGIDLVVNGALTYTWTNAPTTVPPTPVDANADSINVNPQTILTLPRAFNYSVTGTAADGCVSNQAVATVTVIAVPTPYFSPVDTVCSGFSGTLCVDSLPITTTYTWTASSPTAGLGSSSGACVQATPIYFNPFNSQNDTLVYCQVLINLPGCPSYSPHTFHLVVEPLPHVSITKDTINNCNHTGDTLKAITIPAANVNLMWIPKGSTTPLTGLSSNTNEVIVNPTSPKWYYVTPVNEFGCKGIQDSILVLINNTSNCTEVGITLYKVDDMVSIYPNPNNGSFIIEPSNATKQTMQVYDVNGKMVLSQTINGKTNIDASSLAEGVYNISLQSNEGVVNKRVVIVR